MASSMRKLTQLCRVNCRLQWAYNYRSTSSQPEEKAFKDIGTSNAESVVAAKTEMQLEPWVGEALAQEKIRHKRHPGQLVNPVVSVPTRLQEAADVLLEKHPVKELSQKADKLSNYLLGRHPPTSENSLIMKANQLYKEIAERNEKKKGEDKTVSKSEVLHALRQKVYHWVPVEYDAYKSLLYLTSRMASDYSVMLQCFTEILKREPTFSPRNIFDLGSGVGSVIWAADEVWKSKIFEYYCVDSSQDMNTVARLLLQDGENQKEMHIQGVSFHQFAPSSLKNQFDIVVSAYTLLEQPGKKERLTILENLWHMTSDFLILVENGTTAGFTLINEARNHILKMAESSNLDNLKGYIFSPCPHDAPCPKFVEKNQPCFSQISYRPLAQNYTKTGKAIARYSYIVLRKGERKEENEWPRIVQEVVKASKHTHCHLCCADRKVRHTIITQSRHGSDLYKCSRYSVWGDRLPVQFVNSGDDHKTIVCETEIGNCVDNPCI